MSEDSRDEVIYNAFDAYLNIGRHLYNKKDYKRALKYLTHAQELDDTSIICTVLRAACFLYLTQLETALQEANKAYSMSPKNVHALLLIAEAYYQKGEFESALTRFELGRRRRPSIAEFQIGVYKCEQAIWNNCGGDSHIKLSSDMDLTDYYIHSFPAENKKVASMKPEIRGKKKTNTTVAQMTVKPEKWPITMRARSLNRLLGKEYPDYVYIRELHDIEGKRESFLKQSGSTLQADVYPRIKLCADSRTLAMDCAKCLGRKCDLWFKMDPSFKHERRLV